MNFLTKLVFIENNFPPFQISNIKSLLEKGSNFKEIDQCINNERKKISYLKIGKKWLYSQFFPQIYNKATIIF